VPQISILKHVFSVLAFTWLSSQAAHAQRISRIDFDSVKAETTNKNSSHYYPALVKRFQAADTALTRQDFTYLYYGQVYTDQYAPYGVDKDGDFLKYYKEEHYEKAIQVGEKLVAASPLNLNLLFKLLVCYHQLGNKAGAQRYARQYFPIVNAILASGDGKDIPSAYVVAVVHDEYEVMKQLRLSVDAQALVGHTDVLTAVPIDEANKPTGEPARKLYFDVTQPFGHMARQLKRKK
jgi:tetratricopeptide (TPR) repeat protein